MTDTSRRKFLAATGAGAVGTVAVAGTAEAATRGPGSAREEVVAYVADHRLDQVRLLVGEREVVVHDRDLAARILNAAGRK